MRMGILIRFRRAFTLLEIVMVVAIIGILLMIVIPGWRKIRNTAWLRTCQANMKTVYTASQLYLMDHTDSDLPGYNVDKIDIYIKKLVNEGYLRQYVRCPAGNYYAVYNENRNLTVECFHPRSKIRHGKYDGAYHLPKPK